MKTGIHPNYITSTVTCACGYTFQTRSTRPTMRLEICSHCHPFFTGRQKLVDTAGRVERFTRRFEKTQGKTLRVKSTKPGRVVKATPKILSTSAKKVKTEVPKPEKKTAKPAK